MTELAEKLRPEQMHKVTPEARAQHARCQKVRETQKGAPCHGRPVIPFSIGYFPADLVPIEPALACFTLRCLRESWPLRHISIASASDFTEYWSA